jgi:hypothetical protein
MKLKAGSVNGQAAHAAARFVGLASWQVRWGMADLSFVLGEAGNTTEKNSTSLVGAKTARERRIFPSPQLSGKTGVYLGDWVGCGVQGVRLNGLRDALEFSPDRTLILLIPADCKSTPLTRRPW